MHIQMDMTERDKKLLYRLGIIVIIAVFFLGALRPLYTLLKETEADIEVAEETKNLLDKKVQLLPGLVEADATLTAEVEELNKNFYEPMDGAQIDEFFTKYMLSKGLMAKDLVISMPKSTVVLDPYVNSEAGKIRAGMSSDVAQTQTPSDDPMAIAEETLSDGSSTVQDQVASDTTASGIYGVQVSMKVDGSDEKLTKMLDDIETLRPGLRVMSCSYSDIGVTSTINEDGELVLEESDMRQLVITVQLFMTGIVE